MSLQTDSSGASPPQVIDLTTGSTARVRVVRDSDILATMTATQRRRLYVRVLCELVAYDQPDSAAERSDTALTSATAQVSSTG